MEYNFQIIEKKWQLYWDKNKTFKTEIDPHKPKYYALDMFPFPSGSGLHVGHPEGYTATDIISRYKRMKGFNVLHPMGWDSFGLPAENYAIRTGTHPEITTKKNIENFTRQLKFLGFSYDWDREIATSNVDYYKWTQWIFVKLYNKGLAYEDEIEVNWCEALRTVLANEEIVDGKSEVGGHPVVKKKMKQWMLKITEYAERLLDDLEELDWPENIKEMQRNWIGKSSGASIQFQIKNSSKKIDVFTTRPDTIFGATYMVLAPEHPLTLEIADKSKLNAINDYLVDIKNKTDIERTDLNKDKSGVFIGAYAINPANTKEIPIYIASYVLNSYGTGAIMAVPAHDQRDYDFAKKYDLPVIPVLQGGNLEEKAFENDGIHINSDFLDGLDKKSAIEKSIKWIEQKNLGQREIKYKLRDWIFSRQRYWGEPFPILKYEDGSVRCLEEGELPVILPQVERYEPSGTGESPLSTIDTWLNITDPKTGRKAKRETNTMPNWAGSCWYYLRFLDPKNQFSPWSEESEKYWMPVDLYIGGVEHAVLHLLYARFWHKVLFDLELVSCKEPFKKLVNQGLILGPDGEKMSKSRGNVINPDAVVSEFGADALRLYEMFMGPLEKVKPWQENGVKGVYNFLNRSFKFFSDNDLTTADKEDEEVEKLLHKTIKKVSQDIEDLKFNTAISQLMIFVNLCYKKGRISKNTAKTFSLLLSPFAPHLGEELWEILGEKNTLSYERWPDYDPSLAKDDLITIAVQIMGKTRATLEVPSDISQEDFVALAKKEPKISKFLKDSVILKEVFVPGRILNFVIKP